MRRIILISNSHFRCGNATYGRLLQKQLERWYEVSVRSSTDGIYREEVPGTTFVINWHPFRVPVTGQAFRLSQHQGAKFLVVYQNTHDGPLSEQEQEVLCAADVVVAHEKVPALPSARVVPHGIIEVDTLPGEADFTPVIGTAGFPFSWKGFDAVVKIAKDLGVRARIIAPGYDGMDFTDLYRRWSDELRGDLFLVSDFRTEEEVVRLLAKNWVNLFMFESRTPDDGFGQSGSARLGVAAMQPVIFSLHRKLKTLADVPVSSYVVANYAEARESVRTIIERRKQGLEVWHPNKILAEQGWSRAGEMYRDVIEEMWI